MEFVKKTCIIFEITRDLKIAILSSKVDCLIFHIQHVFNLGYITF